MLSVVSLFEYSAWPLQNFTFTKTTFATSSSLYCLEDTGLGKKGGGITEPALKQWFWHDSNLRDLFFSVLSGTLDWEKGGGNTERARKTFLRDSMFS